jgi:hypothetical protein
MRTEKSCWNACITIPIFSVSSHILMHFTLTLAQSQMTGRDLEVEVHIYMQHGDHFYY